MFLNKNLIVLLKSFSPEVIQYMKGDRKIYLKLNTFKYKDVQNYCLLNRRYSVSYLVINN